MSTIILGVAGSIFAVIVWEVILKKYFHELIFFLNQKKVWKNIFNFKGDTTIYKSKVNVSKVSFRASDIKTEELLLKKAKWLNLIKPELQKIDKLTSNIIVIGSVRYNKVAREIQKKFNLNFEYVQQSYASEPDKRILKIISKYGDEYNSSTDNKTLTDNFEIDYGILFIGNINDKKIIWISGIHGIGTIGITSYLTENPKEFIFKNDIEGKGKSWLFRIKYKKKSEENLNSIVEVYIIQEEKDCYLRKEQESKKTIIFDLGNVIMFFDRLRAYRGIAHLLKMNYKTIQSKVEKTNYLEKLETGQITSIEYYEKIMMLFRRKNHIEYSTFREICGDIFWINTNMIEILQQLKNQEIELILVSNTNEIHFQSIKEHYMDILKFFNNKIILSYEIKSMKPDKKIYDEALLISDKNLEYKDCVFIDDKTENVAKANDLGMKGIIFHKHSQLIYELRKTGIYIE